MTKYDFLKITITLTIIAYLAIFQLPDFVHGFMMACIAVVGTVEGFNT